LCILDGQNNCTLQGNLIQERRRPPTTIDATPLEWGGFTKGADRLIVKIGESHKYTEDNPIRIHGVVEIKSMLLSSAKLQNQINGHIARFKGGLKLKEKIFHPSRVTYTLINRIMIFPSTWKLSREWQSIKTERGRKIVLPEPTDPPVQIQIEEFQPNLWAIKLAWSQEAIEQAAYEMTFWYMSQVGKSIYSQKALPKGWEYMTPEEAGYNSIRMMIYYIPLRYITERQARLAYKLYNAYSFGYPFAIDSKKMLWPEDFPEQG
jgi:hypothetical protein